MAAVRKMRKNIERLMEERDRLRIELATMTATLNGRIAGIESAIALLQTEEGDPEQDADRAERGGAKTLLLNLLEEVGTSGLNAGIAEEMAKRRGRVLKRGTAASNLSRLKAESVVTYDGDRYRLPKFARPQPLIVLSGQGALST